MEDAVIQSALEIIEYKDPKLPPYARELALTAWTPKRNKRKERRTAARLARRKNR